MEQAKKNSKIIHPADYKNKRFIVLNGSESAHCCFEFTVIDTSKGKEDYGDYWKETVCETFEKKHAIMICDALNQLQKTDER